MQVSPEELLEEARHMALEIRIKDKTIAMLLHQIQELTRDEHEHGKATPDDPGRA